MKRCELFNTADLEEAVSHLDPEIVKDCGSDAYGHPLHTWDDGGRVLARCRKCGGYILIQRSEFHSFSDDDGDSYYTDYFPVDSEKEAEELNRRYNGFEIERAFKERYLCRSDLVYHWSE